MVQRTGWGKSAVYFVATALRRAEGALHHLPLLLRRGGEVLADVATVRQGDGAHGDLGVLGVHGGDDRGERGAGVGGVGVGLAERGELHGPIPSQGGGSGPGAGGRETVRP